MVDFIVSANDMDYVVCDYSNYVAINNDINVKGIQRGQSKISSIGFPINHIFFLLFNVTY